MKLECAYAGCMLPDYWSGHHLPHVQVPVDKNTTLEQCKERLKNELRDDAVMGSNYDTDNEAWHDAAHSAIDNIIGDALPFQHLEEANEDDESVYAYFVFTTLGD